MKRIFLFGTLICLSITFVHAAELAVDEFKKIFANKKILHAYRENNHYELFVQNMLIKV